MVHLFVIYVFCTILFLEWPTCLYGITVDHKRSVQAPLPQTISQSSKLTLNDPKVESTSILDTKKSPKIVRSLLFQNSDSVKKLTLKNSQSFYNLNSSSVSPRSLTSSQVIEFSPKNMALMAVLNSLLIMGSLFGAVTSKTALTGALLTGSEKSLLRSKLKGHLNLNRRRGIQPIPITPVNSLDPSHASLSNVPFPFPIHINDENRWDRRHDSLIEPGSFVQLNIPDMFERQFYSQQIRRKNRRISHLQIPTFSFKNIPSSTKKYKITSQTFPLPVFTRKNISTKNHEE